MNVEECPSYLQILDYYNFVDKKLASGGRKIRLAHCMTGLAIETLEYLTTNNLEEEKEEIGDCFFYFTGICLTLRIPPGILVEAPNKAKIDEDYYLVQKITNLLDKLKKGVYYKQQKYVNEMFKKIPFNLDTKQIIKEIEDVYISFNFYSTSLEAIIISNMEKLNKRYQNKFSVTESEARKDKL